MIFFRAYHRLYDTKRNYKYRYLTLITNDDGTSQLPVIFARILTSDFVSNTRQRVEYTRNCTRHDDSVFKIFKSKFLASDLRDRVNYIYYSLFFFFFNEGVIGKSVRFCRRGVQFSFEFYRYVHPCFSFV